jgi:dUTP pyrophosphatase
MRIDSELSFALVATMYIGLVLTWECMSTGAFLALLSGIMLVRSYARTLRPEMEMEVPGAAAEGVRHTGESGVDLCPAKEYRVPAGARGFMVDTGVRVAVRRGGSGCMLFLRSSAAKNGLRLANAVGVIDPGYRGTIRACIDNVGTEECVLAPDHAIAQICMPHMRPFAYRIVRRFEERTMDTKRGVGGFGSTGRAGLSPQTTTTAAAHKPRSASPASDAPQTEHTTPRTNPPTT